MIVRYCWPPRINVVDSSSISRMRITLNMCRALTHGVMVGRIECMVYIRPMLGKVKDIRHHRHVLYIPSNPTPPHLLKLIPKRPTATTNSKIEGALHTCESPANKSFSLQCRGEETSRRYGAGTSLDLYHSSSPLDSVVLTSGWPLSFLNPRRCPGG